VSDPASRTATTADRAAAALEAHYRAYLRALNEGRLDDLDAFVADSLTYNDATLTRADYRALLAADRAAIPDLRYRPETLVVAGTEVACRLLFTCTPEREFLGFTPNGTRLTFAEHVFYDFRDNRIAAVKSLIDRHAIAVQLGLLP
jgi:predicted ester cyclase